MLVVDSDTDFDFVCSKESVGQYIYEESLSGIVETSLWHNILVGRTMYVVCTLYVPITHFH